MYVYIYIYIYIYIYMPITFFPAENYPIKKIEIIDYERMFKRI